MDSSEPYWLRIHRLRTEQGLSVDEVIRRGGPSRATINFLERPYDPTQRGPRYPSADMIERVAAALDVEPAEFPEYRLARARELLDERIHGLEQALRCLEAFDAALREPDGSSGFVVPTAPRELLDSLAPQPEAPPQDAGTRHKRRSGGQAS